MRDQRVGESFKLPRNPDAERPVLGAILLDNDALPSTIKILEPADFSLDAHRRVFARMVTLSESRRPIDMITLSEELERTGELEAVGGSAYLSALVDGLPRISNVEHYARIVKEKSELRKLAYISQNILSRATRRDADPETLTRELSTRVASLASATGNALTVSAQQAKATLAPEWPSPPSDAVYHGLAGRVIRAIEAETEADPVAILAQLLVVFGNMCGRGPFFVAESDAHYANLFAVLVGQTSKGRKGSSWARVRNFATAADPMWAAERILSGLSSGEGLIWAVRDPVEQRQPIREKGRVVDYQMVQTDPGVEDKRLLAVETEFCAPLRLMARDGNILSTIIRQAWDTGNLRVLTKTSPAKSTGAHISIVGHSTKEELVQYLESTEAAAGFANRFLWLCVRRSKLLPEGGMPNPSALRPLEAEFTKAVECARKVGEIRRDLEARAAWASAYTELSEGKPGLFGAVIARAEAQVMRLAMIYALLDLSAVVRVDHLEAALALWNFAEASARFIFGTALGDPLADELLAVLKSAPADLSRTEISARFGRHRPAHELDRALGVLQAAGLVKLSTEPTGGRPAERWRALTRRCESSEKSETRSQFPPVSSLSSLDSQVPTASSSGGNGQPWQCPPGCSPPHTSQTEHAQAVLRAGQQRRLWLPEPSTGEMPS